MCKSGQVTDATVVQIDVAGALDTGRESCICTVQVDRDTTHVSIATFTVPGKVSGQSDTWCNTSIAVSKHRNSTDDLTFGCNDNARYDFRELETNQTLTLTYTMTEETGNSNYCLYVQTNHGKSIQYITRRYIRSTYCIN
jgi:hypothetical protein